jgi:hypothetical protein
MTDATGHKNRPGAGPYSPQIFKDGVPINYYINTNPTTGRAEIAKLAPPGTEDTLVKDFADRAAAGEWFDAEWRAERLR